MRRKFGGFPIQEGFPTNPDPSKLKLGLSRDSRLVQPSGTKISSDQRRRQSLDLGTSHGIPGEGNREPVPHRIASRACHTRRGARPGAPPSVAPIGGELAIGNHR